jgi:ABC-type transport system involved in multi-copper enzyme maturation permease subunit
MKTKNEFSTFNFQLSTLLLIAKKDFLLNMISARFVIGFLLCLAVIPFTLVVGVDSYKKQMRVYEVYEKEVDDAKKEIRVYSQIRPEIVTPLNPLSIFSRGINDNLGSRVRIQLGAYPLFPEGNTGTRDNPLLNAFFSIDFATVIAILMSLLALVFSYDIFTREREDGTLKAALASEVSRTAFLTGKLLGIFITLTPILLFCFLLGILVIAVSPAVQFSAGEWGGVALLFLSSLLYLAVFILLGMFISTKSRRSSTSIVVSLLCWIWFLFLMPNIASYLSQSFVKTEMYDNVQFAMYDLNNQFGRECDEKSNSIQAELGMNGVSHWNWSNEGDGTEIMSGCVWETNEYHRRFNIWREPARIDYADKKWAIQKNYLDGLVYQNNIQAYLSWLSPAGIFGQIADIQCRSGQSDFLRTMEHIRVYRESVIRYFNDKKLFESFSYFTPQPESTFPKQEDYAPVIENFQQTGKFEAPEEWQSTYYPPLNLGDVPVFEYKGATVSSAMNDSLGRMAGLLALCIVLLGATVVSFFKYDVR